MTEDITTREKKTIQFVVTCIKCHKEIPGNSEAQVLYNLRRHIQDRHSGGPAPLILAE